MREWIVKNSVLFCSILVAIAFLATMGRTAIQSISGLAVAGAGSQWINLQDISVGTPIISGAADVGLFGYNGTSWDALKTATVGNTVAATGLGVSTMYGEFLTVLPTLTNGTYGAIQFDSSGRIILGTSTASIGSVVSAGAKTPADGFAVPTDGSDTLSFLMGFNGTTYDRIRSIANNADAVAVTTLGIIPSGVYNYGFNGTTWDRLRSTANNADAQAVVTLGDLQVNSYLMGFNGTTWDRLRSTANNADAVAVTTLGNQTSLSYRYGFNGTTWDRLRSGGNATDAEATTSLGLQETDSYLRGFNGTTFDRLKSEGNNADGVATSTLGSLMQKAYAMIFNGTTWDRQRSGVVTGMALTDSSSNTTSHIVTDTTTTVKATAGVLNMVVTNVVGTTSSVTLYDIASGGCTGTPASGFVAKLITTTLGTMSPFNHTFQNGICAVTASGGAADISILYR